MEKGLLDPINIVINSLFIKKIMEYPNKGKFKLPSINLYNGTKDSIDQV